MILASGRRWGRLIELVTHTLAFAEVEGLNQIDRSFLAKTFRRWTGASDGANVLFIENPYRVEVKKLHPK
jgi:hypothetical protein